MDGSRFALEVMSFDTHPDTAKLRANDVETRSNFFTTSLYCAFEGENAAAKAMLPPKTNPLSML